LVAFVISYFKLIGWEIEGREYAAAGGNYSPMIGNFNPYFREVLCTVT
jgi:hypothetical protein